MDYCVITFASAHAALSAQALLEPLGRIQVMPVLRVLSAECGISLRFPPALLPRVRVVLEDALARGECTLYAVSGSGTTLSAAPL